MTQEDLKQLYEELTDISGDIEQIRWRITTLNMPAGLENRNLCEDLDTADVDLGILKSMVQSMIIDD